MFTKQRLFKNLILGADGIWGTVTDYGEQNDEKLLRESVAKKKHDDYLTEISFHHSIPVMDTEITKFIEQIPKNGTILDIGGCWGWHWRDVLASRSDLTIIIFDLIRENLIHAKELLKEISLKNKVYLVHGNACQLKFDDETFDGIWSVQTTQHIPNFEQVCKECFRVLKKNGIYWDYNLNNAFLIRAIYRLFNKTYHLKGNIPGRFYLRRVDKGFLETIDLIFKQKPDIRYSEIIFTPDLGLPLGGKVKSFTGKIDSLLSGKFSLLKILARQCSVHVQKN